MGINGGGGLGSAGPENPAVASTDMKGGIVGPTLGANLQMGHWVIGVEADWDWSGIIGSSSCVPGAAPVAATCTGKINWIATTRGRLGYTIDRVLLYITGGAAFDLLNVDVPTVGSNSFSRHGWVAGGGLEFIVMGPWTAKLEYLHLDLGGFTCNCAAAGFPAVPFKESTTDLVRIGVNYKLGG